MKDHVEGMREELESLNIEDIYNAIAANLPVKQQIHKLLIDSVKNGPKLNMSKREYGLLVVAEGLIILSAATEGEKNYLASN